jgi:hypothetical protein
LSKVTAALYLLNLLGIGVILWNGLQEAATALLWALASLAVGGLVGFLFGIPRVIQSAGQGSTAKPPPGEPTALGPADEDSYRQQVNTNLEQVSDWLTKIIVGLGLIELKNVPAYLESVAAFLTESPKLAFAGGVIVYFALVGFFVGYLLTRLFLAPAFGRVDPLKRAVEKAKAEVKSEVKEEINAVRDFATTTRQAVTEGVARFHPGGGAAAAAERAATGAGEDADPQKGKWGGQSEQNGRRLSGQVTPLDGGEDFFRVLLEVRSTDPARPLEGEVVFHLHPTFRDPRRVVPVTDGVAALTVLAWGAFTAGAEADGGATHLELDLATLPDAPQKFRSR